MIDISIIVPVYNVQDYLPNCIESILKNDTEGCEIILVDDGATDNSGAICDAWAEKDPQRIRVIHQPNGGLGAARNTGIEAASGEWFLFVDSDDRIHPDTIAVLRRACRPELDVIGFQFFADNGIDPPQAQSCGFPAMDQPFTLQEHRDYLLSLPSVWLRLWRRTLFTERNIRFPARDWYEDIRTTAKLLLSARKILVLPEPLYYYLSRPGSIMNNKNLGRNTEIMLAIEDIIDWYRTHGMYETFYDELCALTIQHVLLAASVRVARIDPKSEILDELARFTAERFPDWKKNPYSKTLPRLKRLALYLVAHRRYGLIRTLFKLKG